MSELKLPLDPTGVDAGNLVSNEVVNLVNRTVRAIVPEYGAFFAESCIVVDMATGLPLDKGTQYLAAEMYAAESKLYGKEICAIILIVDPTVSNQVKLQYQALGGESSYSVEALRLLIAGAYVNDRPAEWLDVIDILTTFQPAPHQHDRDDTYGWEYVQDELLRLSASIADGGALSTATLITRLKEIFTTIAPATIAEINDALSVHTGIAHPHVQYARAVDINAAFPLVTKPVMRTPVDLSTNVNTQTPFQGSPYYSYYGVAMGGSQFQIGTQADFAAGILFDDVVNDTTGIDHPGTLLPINTLLYARLRYKDIEGVWSDWSVPISFTTGSVFVAAPTITAPASGVTNVIENPTFTSSAFAVNGGSDSHASSDWEIRTVVNGAWVTAYTTVNNVGAKTQMTVPLLKLAPNTKYYARVRYKGAVKGLSLWSPDISFTTKASFIDKPVILSPANNTVNVVEPPVVFTSAYSVGGAVDPQTSTDWEMWTGANGTGTLAYSSENDPINLTSFSFPFGSVNPNTVYFIRARYRSTSHGDSQWSDDCKITTAATFTAATLGQAYGGGFWAGNIIVPQGEHLDAGTYAIVLAPKATGEISSALSTSNGAVDGYSLVDNARNTAALLPLGGAAAAVRALSINGYSDWQIPAINMLSVIHDNLRPAIAASLNINAFKTGGAEALSTVNNYWSSTTNTSVRNDSYNDADTPIIQQQPVSYSATSAIGAEACAAGYQVTGIRPTNYDVNGVPHASQYWCVGTSSAQIGTQPGAYHPVATQLYQATSQNIGTGVNSVEDKTVAHLVRAVRLVRVG